MVRIPVFDGTKIEVREYTSVDIPKDELYLHHTVVLVESATVGAYVRVRESAHPLLPYAYFHLNGLEYYAYEQSFSTALRRYMELLALVEAVARVQALMG